MGTVNMATQLSGSSVGQFLQACADGMPDFAKTAQSFTLPKVVVIGDSETGKTCLLEAITRRGILPVDLSTKLPIKLQLIQVQPDCPGSIALTFQGKQETFQSRQHVAAALADIMSRCDDIVSNEVCIDVHQAEVPSCTFIDIPGVQTFPPNNYERSLGLLSKYVRDSDTVVLCVVTASSLAKNSIALKMVREAKKLPQTILVLSRSDHIRSEQQTENLIFSRLLGTSPDMQYLEGLAGCIAVANCHQACEAAGMDDSAAEHRLFSHMLHDTSTAYAASGTQQQLRERMTVAQLIVRLDRFYHQRVVEEWVPAAEHKCDQTVPQIVYKLGALGPKPELLTASHVVEVIGKLVNTMELSQKLCGFNIMVNQGTQPIALSAFQMPKSVQWGTVPWAASLAAVEEKLKQAIDKFWDSNAMLRILQSAVKNAFHAQSHLQLERFESLQELLLFQQLPDLIAESKEAARPVKEQALQAALMQLHSASPPDDMLQQLDSTVRGCLIRHVLCALSTLPSLPSEFILSEAAAVQAKRALLNEQLMQTQALLQRLQRAEDMFNSTAMGPPWWESEEAQLVEPCNGSGTITDSPSHAAVWESVRHSLQMQQAVNEDLAPYTATLTPIDPAGAHVSQSALAGSGSTVPTSLPSITLPVVTQAYVPSLPSAAGTEAEMETITLASEPAHWQHCSEAGESWQDILDAQSPGRAHDADMFMPFAT